MAENPRGGYQKAQSQNALEQEYTAEEVASIAKRFELTARKMVANKSNFAMLAAAELNLLKATEAVRDVCQLAVKDSSEAGRDQLVSVFGGSCEKIGRMLAVLDSVSDDDFSGDNANDKRWNDARESIKTIKAILEELGVFRVWTPGNELLPPTQLVCQGLFQRYEPGDRIQIEIEYEGGVPTEYSIDKPLPAGLRFDKRTGKILGKVDNDMPDLVFTITAKNDNGVGEVELVLKVGPPPPSLLSYDNVPSRLRLGQLVEWIPAFEGTRCVFHVDSPMPNELQFDTKTGKISGRVTEVGTYRWSVTAANACGKLEAAMAVTVVDFRLAEEICACTDLEELWTLEPERTQNQNWMIWMVHRVYLNDHTLTEFNFTNMPMPPPKIEPRIARKLMQALGTNTHLEFLLLAGSKLRPPSGLDLAEALRQNSTLRVLNVETNLLTIEVVQACAAALAENTASNVEEWRFANQAGLLEFGDSTEEKIAEMMKANKKILKLGFAIKNGGHRSTIDRCILKNSDLRRKRTSTSQVADSTAV